MISAESATVDAVSETLAVTDPQALRALAHPLRQRILFELTTRGHARAADLAQALGEPANSVSFHLRVLARAGLIAEAPEHARDKRDRVWRPVADRYAVEPTTPGYDAVTAPVLAWARDVLTARTPPGEAAADQPLHLGTVNQARLTRAEAQQLAAELAAVLDTWRARGSRAADDEAADPTRIVYQAVLVLGPHTEPR
jgi:DNA-binding transcriptional ArsR family regulator